MKTIGISPKVVSVVVTAVVGWVVTRYGIDLDPEACAAIVLALLTTAGVVAPPGRVVPE